MNGADGISDIEHVAIGIARVDGNAARVAGASTGSASDQGKVARVATSKLGNERVSNSTFVLSTMLCSSSARYRCPLSPRGSTASSPNMAKALTRIWSEQISGDSVYC